MNIFKRSVFGLIVTALIFPLQSFCQLTVTPGSTAAALAAKLAGPGITISSPTLTCATVANGTFISVGTPLTIDSGIILCTGQAVQASGPETFLASTNLGMPGDPTLAALAMATTYDACALEFDLVPNGDTISFHYQFGSNEYRHSTCGPYNDAFAFFISGPGITGTANMALIPGTTIPVTVNSVNSGTPGAGYTLANCTAMGAGSPFTGYFYNNIGGTQLTYCGFTVDMLAVHSVIPCNTYHLKIAICDAGNAIYDSGVFIKAGSLTTNSYSFDHIDSIGHTINGIPNTIVKGCSPATIKVYSAHPATSNQTVHFTFGGTAVQNSDFTAPDSATIVTGADSVLINVSGIPTLPGGTKTVEIYLLSPFSCGVADSITLNIMDTPSAHIITPDTTICAGQSFQIRVYGTSGLSYSWTPTTGLSSPTVMEPIASPVVTTTYSMTATLPGSGCPPILSDVTVTIHDLNVSLLTPNDTICIGSSVNLRVSGSPAYNYNWSPATGLSNPYSQDPVATPTVTTTYHVSVSDSGCSGSSSLTITVLNPDPAILTQDTAICDGVSFTLQVLSNPGITYLWTPSSGLSNPNIPDPVASPTVSVTYTLTATTATSSGIPCSANNEIIVTVLPPLLVNAGPDQSICLNSAIKLSATPEGNQYSYTWSGPDGFNSNLENPSIFKSQPAYQGIYSVTVTNTSTGCSGQDTTFVTVYMGSFNLTNVTPSQTISYGSSIQLNADNGLYYMWTPDNGTLSNPNINNPVATPLIPTTYTVYAMDIHGCNDSASVTIDLTYSDIFIPSAFTPNGDGLNDVFAVGHLGLNKLVEMSVFNRWGQLVYHAEGSESKGWDGTFNGVLQDMGVFNYLIIVNKPNTGDQVYKGNVTLIK